MEEGVGVWQFFKCRKKVPADKVYYVGRSLVCYDISRKFGDVDRGIKELNSFKVFKSFWKV